MKWHIGLSQNPKPQSDPIPWFIIILPIKKYSNMLFWGCPFFQTPNYCIICFWLLYICIHQLYHMLLIVTYVYIYIYIIHMCISLLGLPFADLRFNDTISISVREKHLYDMFFVSRYYPEFKMFGTHPIFMLLVCVCVSHYYPNNGWYSVWTIPHYYLHYGWFNCYCIMFILIIITKHTHYIHIYKYIHTYIWKYVCIQWYFNLNIIPLCLV